jgi:hypothetical protein
VFSATRGAARGRRQRNSCTRGILVVLALVIAAVGAAPAPAEAATCRQQTLFGPGLGCAQTDAVGNGKTIATTTALSRRGLLVVSSHAINRHVTEGLRGRVLVVVLDRRGNHIWVSQEFQHPTLCSRLDLFCASSRRSTFTEPMPAVIGQNAAWMDIHHADGGSFRDLRESVINGIRTSEEIGVEVREAVCRVLGGA